jgi:hypothetical protein
MFTQFILVKLNSLLTVHKWAIVECDLFLYFVLLLVPLLHLQNKSIKLGIGRVMAQAVSYRLPTAAACSQVKLGHVGFVVDQVALGQVSSEYFGFLYQFAFQRLPHNHHHLSPGTGTVGQIVAAIPSGHSLTPRENKKKSLVRVEGGIAY